MTGRRARFVWFALLALEAAAGLGLWSAAAENRREAVARRVVVPRIARHLHLSDLALWSGASYCRHLATTEPIAAIADHPGALEHLPAGAVVAPPRQREEEP